MVLKKKISFLKNKFFKDVRTLAASTPNEVGLGHLALASPPIAGNVTLRRPTDAHSARRTAVARARAVGGERAAFKRSRVNDCGGIGLYHFNDTHMRSGAAVRPASGPRRRPGETDRASLIGAHPASWWWTESHLIGLSGRIKSRPPRVYQQLSTRRADFRVGVSTLPHVERGQSRAAAAAT